jgi:hypothetical protein
LYYSDRRTCFKIGSHPYRTNPENLTSKSTTPSRRAALRNFSSRKHRGYPHDRPTSPQAPVDALCSNDTRVEKAISSFGAAPCLAESYRSKLPAEAATASDVSDMGSNLGLRCRGLLQSKRSVPRRHMAVIGSTEWAQLI